MGSKLADSLLVECVLPGCRTPVVTVGEPCDGCVEAFGPMLVCDPGAPRMTADEIAERDRSVHNVYVWQAMKRQESERG
ncbi:hypothetical protein ATM97_07025 [Nocardia sp. MH4]|uniref:hypothetical protein n=1 Tax=Nocardia sp. MH4 TaxID=1768677 RepID=UPI001C4F26BC|nr:hypothetical protein [Nocardia sp. MH4]MBW0270765.1 hypothetical protein [Nocardia sp. MH4]